MFNLFWGNGNRRLGVEFACLGSKILEPWSNTLLKSKQTGCRNHFCTYVQISGMISSQIFGLWFVIIMKFCCLVLRLWCWDEECLIKALYLGQKSGLHDKLWLEKKIAADFDAKSLHDLSKLVVAETLFTSCIKASLE